MTTDSVAVRLVSDGTFLLDGGPMFGPVPKILWEQNAKPDRKNRVRLGLNSLLIKTPHANILVDAGIGNKEPEITREIYGHSSSKLLRNLRHNSVSAREIDFVILTHLAFSHSGGATRLDQEGTIIPTFRRQSTSCSGQPGTRRSHRTSGRFRCTVPASNTCGSSMKME